jgi:hypothetical protein
VDILPNQLVSNGSKAQVGQQHSREKAVGSPPLPQDSMGAQAHLEGPATWNE